MYNLAFIFTELDDYLRAYPLLNRVRSSKEVDKSYAVFIGEKKDRNLINEQIRELDFITFDYSYDHSLTESHEICGFVGSTLKTLVESKKIESLVISGNSEAALHATRAGNKLGCNIIALDSGLRSDQLQDLQEINRIVIDAIADVHLVSESSGIENLLKLGVKAETIYKVGYTFLDTLELIGDVQQPDGVKSDSGYIFLDVNFDRKDKRQINIEELLAFSVQLSNVAPIVLSVNSDVAITSQDFGKYELFDDKLHFAKDLKLVDKVKYVQDSLVTVTNQELTQLICYRYDKQCVTFGKSSVYTQTILNGKNSNAGNSHEKLVDLVSLKSKEQQPSSKQLTLKLNATNLAFNAITNGEIEKKNIYAMNANDIEVGW